MLRADAYSGVNHTALYRSTFSITRPKYSSSKDLALLPLKEGCNAAMGYTGVLCGLCLPDYYLTSTGCRHCQRPVAENPMDIIFLILIVFCCCFILVGACRCTAKQLKVKHSGAQRRLCFKELSRTGKILVNFGQ